MERTEKLQKRGKAIARMGLVEWEGSGKHSFRVATPSLRGRQQWHRVAGDWKSASCTCLEWEEHKNEREFFCEHKWAVHFQQIGA